MSASSSQRSSILGAGMVAGAVWGAMEARWALPSVQWPALSAWEWWGAWLLSVAAGAAVGAIAGLMSTLLLSRRPQRARGLAAGLCVASLAFAALLAHVRPLLGPISRELLLLGASLLALVPLLVLLLLPPGTPRRALLGVGCLVALGATVDGARRILPDGEDRATQRAQHPNVLLLTLDTVRADHLWPPPSWLPQWKALSEGATALTGLAAPVPLTGPSHASMLTGLPPHLHGAIDNGHLIFDGVATLSERLGKRGYTSGAVVSAAVLHRRLCGLDRGFDSYDDSFRPAVPWRRLAAVQAVSRVSSRMQGRPEGLSRGRRADEVATLGLRFLRRHRDEPWMLWLHFYDPHAPYDPVAEPVGEALLPPLAGEPTAGDRDYWEQRSRYAAELVDVDRALGRLMDGLREMALDDNTLILVVNDHGESFGTHGRGYRFDHGAYVFDDCVRQIALWREPASSTNARTRVDQTLPPEYLHDALLKRVEGGVVAWPAGAPTFSHAMIVADTLWTCLRSASAKLIRGQTRDGETIFEAYALDRDPEERDNLLPAGSRPSAVGLGEPWSSMETVLEDSTARARASWSQEVELSDVAREALRSLGYIR